MAQTLKSLFTHHLQAVSPDLAMNSIERLWLDIEQRYSEPHRAYHTLAHLEFIFAQFFGIAELLRQPHLVALALFYHDIIYHVGDKSAATVAPKSNEALSADYAAAQLKEWLNPEQIQRIYDLILLTENHQLIDAEDSDAAYLLDFDLSVLGAPWSTYQRYAQAVRFEYQHVPLEAYRLGRTKVLQHLLDHPRLYMTEKFYTQFEESARANIARELQSL
jgi:predicted metal-dependent HD superfamily phosphohydrolase